MRGKGFRGLVALVAAAAMSLPACFGGDPSQPSDPPASTVADRFGSLTIAPGDPITIGTLLTPSDGTPSWVGRDAERGVQLAVDFLDGTLDGVPGEFLGHPVEVVNASEGCTDDAATEGQPFDGEMNDLVGVIGPGCAASVLQGPGVALADDGIVMISPTATDAALTGQGRRSPFFFRTAYDDRLEGVAVAGFAIDELEADRAGIAYDDADTSGAATAFRTAFEEDDGIVSASGSLADPAVSPDRVMRALGEVGPTVVYLDATDPVCAQAARQAGEVSGLQGVPLVGGSGCFDPSFLPAVRGEAYLAGPDSTRLMADDFYRMEFLPAYEEQFGTAPPAMFHAQAFDATIMMLDAVERVAERADDGTLTVGRGDLRDAVAATSGVSGLSGTITCGETGDCAQEVSIAIYRVPAVPIDGGTADPEPLFTQTVSLDDLVP